MKSALILLLAVTIPFLSSCGGGESDLQMKAGFENTYVINAAAKSCYAKKTTPAGEVVPDDITESFFQIQQLYLSWPHADKSFVIAMIRIKLRHPAFDSGEYKCEIGGDALLALNQTWWAKGEAVVGGPEIPSAYNPTSPTERYTPQQLLRTDCSLLCGNLPGDVGYVVSGSIEAIGFHRKPSGELEPNRVYAPITVESLQF